MCSNIGKHVTCGVFLNETRFLLNGGLVKVKKKIALIVLVLTMALDARSRLLRAAETQKLTLKKKWRGSAILY